MYVLLTIRFPKQKWCIYSSNLYKTSQNTHYYNPVSTVQFLQVIFGSPDSTVQYLLFSLGPAYRSTQRVRVNTSLKKSEQSILEIFNEKWIMHSPEHKNHFKSTSIKTFNVYNE